MTLLVAIISADLRNVTAARQVVLKVVFVTPKLVPMETARLIMVNIVENVTSNHACMATNCIKDAYTIRYLFHLCQSWHD